MSDTTTQITVNKRLYGKLSMQKIMLNYYKNTLGSKKDATRSLYKLCVESIQKSISEITSSLEYDNYHALYSALHNLKGVLGSTGLNELMGDATVLCRHAKSLSSGEIKAISPDFARALNDFKEPLLLLCKGGR
jgi:HPt (histidine-containing phosphotransfer) domain-containing protein